MFLLNGDFGSHFYLQILPAALITALRRLTSAGLAFSTEDDLRDEGQAVTPDVKLTVPISIDGYG